VNTRLLIDGIVRQTTVLIAQLSTAAGVRAPLAHIADQVFLDLAREIEAQGVGRKVVADMFGMALRSYQKKVQRLTESVSEKNRTLWQALLEFLRDGSKTRSRITERFYFDGEREVGAVLNDLLSSGLVYCTGRGEGAVYGLTSEADLHTVAAGQDVRSIANVVWLEIFLKQAATEQALAERLNVDSALVSQVLEVLVRERRIRYKEGQFEASNVVIPVGTTEGWEAAVIDHFRAVTTAIAAKATTDLSTDQVGGTTLGFSVYPGHPHEAAVKGLLRSVREQVHALWNQVAEYNQQHRVPEDAEKVTFYAGQMVTVAEPEAADGGADV
jgi:hypothetical protein